MALTCPSLPEPQTAFMEEDSVLSSDLTFYWVDRRPLIGQKSGIEKIPRDLLRKMTQLIKSLTSLSSIPGTIFYVFLKLRLGALGSSRNPGVGKVDSGDLLASRG